MPLYIKLLHAAFSAELQAVLPVILLLLVVGLATAVVQAALQIEEPTFSLLPKTVAMVGIALLGGLGAMQVFARLALMLIGHAAVLARLAWN